MLPADHLDALLTGASERRRDTARRLVTCLRLVLDSGRSTPAGVVRLSLDRARDELEAQSRRRLLRALLDLARHGLAADLGPASFAWCGEPELARQRAWSVIEEHRDELPWLPEVPAPNERSAETVTRLLDAAARSGLSPEEEREWRLRALRAREGPERAEQAWRELCEARLRAGGLRAAEALAGWVECLLDRGAVRLARQALDEQPALAERDERLSRLSVWARLCCGDEPAARAAESGWGPWRGALPAALLELREAVPAWVPRLSGRAVEALGAPCELARVPADARALRRACGAAVVAAFALGELGRPSLIEFDAAPALRERASEWLRQLESACREPGSPENLLVVRAAPQVVQRSEALAPRHALSAAAVRAVALAPILDARGEVQGWLRLEFEHHLVPPRAALVALGAAWRARLEPASAPVPVGDGLAATANDDGEGPCAEALRALVAELGLKTAQRRWWGFELRDGALRRVCEGGAALGAERGGGRALQRALRSSALVRFDEPERSLSLSDAAASGLVLPVGAGGELCGFVAIESARRNDFAEPAVQRWVERARSCLELRIARFREWHRARYGSDVWFCGSSGSSPGWVEHVFAAARSRVPCALSGPAGSGRRVVARWLQFESGRGAAPLLALSAASDERALWGEGGVSPALLERARGGTILLFDLERLSAAGQLRALELCDARPAEQREAPRWILASHLGPAELARSGALRPDLCRRLERLQVRVPSLAERRVELPRIAQALARRCAAEERVAPPSFDDEALALLWRQPWHGNVRELENLVFKVVLMHPGREVGRDELERTARRFGVELVRRVPSRQPDAELVRAALTTTANLRGSINKTRAALYLGWDPDTLVTRLNELAASDAAGSAPGAAGADPSRGE